MMVGGALVGVASYTGSHLKKSLSFDRRKSRHQPTPLPSDLTSSGSGSSSNGSAAPGSGSSSRSGTPPASLPQGLAGLSPLRGTLSKRCHTTKRWVSRFIEVDDQRGLLLYYSTSSTTPSSMPSRVYLLCELESVQPLSLANKWAFEVVFVGGTKGQQRKLLCNCESEEVEVRWVKGLETRLAWRESFYARPRCAQRVHIERPVGMHLGLTVRGAAGSLRFGVEVAGASAGDLAAAAGVGVGDLILSVRDTVVSEPRGAVALLDDSGPGAAAPGAPAKIDFVILMKQRGGGAAAGAEGAGEGGGEEGGADGEGGGEGAAPAPDEPPKVYPPSPEQTAADGASLPPPLESRQSPPAVAADAAAGCRLCHGTELGHGGELLSHAPTEAPASPPKCDASEEVMEFELSDDDDDELH